MRAVAPDASAPLLVPASAPQVEVKLQQARYSLDSTTKHIAQVQAALVKLHKARDEESKDVKKIVEDDKWYVPLP